MRDGYGFNEGEMCFILSDLGYTNQFCVPEVTSVFFSSCDSVVGDFLEFNQDTEQLSPRPTTIEPVLYSRGTATAEPTHPRTMLCNKRSHHNKLSTLVQPLHSFWSYFSILLQ